jgi:Arc/MetJ-type ribon-helix-helix transcriptional regulator
MTVQIAVKLPEALASKLDQLVTRGDFPNRSQALREGLETILAAREQEQLRERYRLAVARHPETPAEMEDVSRLAVESIEEEPWERWW